MQANKIARNTLLMHGYSIIVRVFKINLLLLCKNIGAWHV